MWAIFLAGCFVGGFIAWQISGRVAVRRITEFEHRIRLDRAGLLRRR
jgi:hypothetical protein